MNGNNTPESRYALIDAIAAVLRFRFMIAVSFLTALIAAGTYFYLLPILGMPTSAVEYTATISASVREIPVDLEDYLDVKIPPRVEAYFNSLPLQVEVYERHYELGNGGGRERAITKFKNEVLGHSLRGAYDRERNSYTISFSSTEKGKAEAYVSDLWSSLGESVRKSVFVEAEEAKRRADSALATYGGSGKLDALAGSALAETAAGSSGLQAFIEDESFPFGADNVRITYLAERSSRSRTVGFISFSVLLLAVGIALALDYWRELLANPRSAEKIKAALTSGRRKG